MKNYIIHDPWSIIEEGFDPHHNKISESLFSIGNGRMGQRANFEEQYSGETLSGSYVAGVYYPDKTKVGWWKNGYPDYFAKVLNAANWIGIHIAIDGVQLDLAKCEVSQFRRELNMKEGYLERSFIAKMKNGYTVRVEAKRFCSIVNDEGAAIRYAITPLNFNANMSVCSFVDADVVNTDSNYDEKFWVEVSKSLRRRQGYVVAETKKTAFQVCTGMKFDIVVDGKSLDFESQRIKKDKYVGCSVELKAKEGREIIIYKYAANLSSENHPKEELMSLTEAYIKTIFEKGFDTMLQEQAAAWDAKWKESDIIIEGDVAAQQGIRFNIFQLNQTYTGEDERLNIGPKGFTGEKYGGSTYWDTEAYCLPFYLATADSKVAKNLLLYRYKQLDKAIENAAKLGFKDGAALYPMVTMNGEECHNEWEITFEEIHRNGAIAYAIYDYIRYTGDKEYILEAGLEVLVAIARFWSQRVHYSRHKKLYVMHGVTGPNEYDNNVNNNWYTSTMAVWCMEFAMEALAFAKTKAPRKHKALVEKMRFQDKVETDRWKDIINNMYLPENKEIGIYLQQEDYLDKDLLTVSDLSPEDRPLNQKWSWDRILRSCFIKQADVLQGLYFFEERYDVDTVRRNFDFYEPRTVHESSLSPCVHVILATKIGRKEKAYELYLRTSRLDLDDYNNDTEDGCHTTSMAGTWMSVVKGFGGMRVAADHIHFNPTLPEQWQSLSFKVRFRGNILQVSVSKEQVTVQNFSRKPIELFIMNEKHTVHPKAAVTMSL